MTYECEILSVTSDGVNWITLGRDRAEAEAFYRRVLAEGRYPRPIYRVVAKRKPIVAAA